MVNLDHIFATAGGDGAAVLEVVPPPKGKRGLFRVVAIDFTRPATGEEATVELWAMSWRCWRRAYAGIAESMGLRAVALGPIVVAVRMLG